jgi:hypothetical protein
MWVIVETMSPRISGLYNSENDSGPAVFSYWHRRPDHQPEDRISGRRPKSGYQPSNPVNRVVRRKLSFTHTNAYTNMVTHAGRAAGMPQHSKSKCHCRGGKSVPGKAARTRKSQGGVEHGPFGGRLSYCVSFMQQGKVQESLAPPKSSLVLALSLYLPRKPTNY